MHALSGGHLTACRVKVVWQRQRGHAQARQQGALATRRTKMGGARPSVMEECGLPHWDPPSAAHDPR